MTHLLKLPIDDVLPEIVDAARASRRVVVLAPPGAGKTTRVPPALIGNGRVIVLQPRRVAARSIARRIAEERGWTVGEEVGWQVRLENRFSSRTRLLLATEGILTARLHSDPLLSEFQTVILDEFHERSIHADIALAIMKEVLTVRDDLRLVVMSATLDAGRVSTYLDGCPVVEVAASLHPVSVSYSPRMSVENAVRGAMETEERDILCFLPGRREIDTAVALLRDLSPAAEILPLHGSLTAEQQDAAIRPSSRRRVIVATNIAETSITVEGVRTVVDSGLERILQYDSELGLDRLLTQRISVDSAAQRAGRAGRVAPGRAIRLWDERDILEPHREPEVARADLAAAVLEIVGWGSDPFRFDWFDRPPEHQLEAAGSLLRQLGAIDRDRWTLTADGERLRRLPLHPRLGRLIIEAGGSDAAIFAAIVIEEGRRLPRGDSAVSSDSDILQLADEARRNEQSRRQAAQIRKSFALDRVPDDHERLLRGIAAAYPDRIAKRRERNSKRLLLASGHGAVLAAESSVKGGEFLACIDVAGIDRSQSGAAGEALVRMASLVRKEWLTPTHLERTLRFESSSRAVRATETAYYGAIVLAERPVDVEPEEAVELLTGELERRWHSDDQAVQLIRRSQFAGVSIDLRELARSAVAGSIRLPDLGLADALPYQLAREIDRLAPVSVPLPSGRSSRLDYRDDGSVFAAVKLQELFGLAESPRIGREKIPVTFELLAPNGRPVQTTRDLRSFWERTYPEVRKDLRGRYPKHPWPEDPWSAEPTHRTKRR